MSLRQRVDRSQIELFLKSLAERFRRPARIYLVGGTTMVFESFRLQTIDIDLTLEVEAADHSELIRAIRGLKESLSLNIEEVSPGDFIPLPSGYQARHEFIDRVGTIDVFHFDLYSVALSKIERGRTQDMHDVLGLLGAGRLQWEMLQSCFEDVLPRMGVESLRQDPIEFEQNFRAIESLWRSGSQEV